MRSTGNNNNNRKSNCESAVEERRGQRISFSHQINGLDYAAAPAHRNGDSFIVDIDSQSQSHNYHHFSDKKDVNPNSRATLQRSLSRKGSIKKKSNNNDPTNNNNHLVTAATSPRGFGNADTTTLHNGNSSSSTPEKSSMVVTVGSTAHAVVTTAQLHNGITIINVAGNGGSGSGGGGTPSESKNPGRRFSFKRSSSFLTWAVIDPRRILVLFATLSCMGTTLLIYLTLSMRKFNGEEQ